MIVKPGKEILRDFIRILEHSEDTLIESLQYLKENENCNIFIWDEDKQIIKIGEKLNKIIKQLRITESKLR